jgi:hypothetical protein
LQVAIKSTTYRGLSLDTAFYLELIHALADDTLQTVLVACLADPASPIYCTTYGYYADNLCHLLPGTRFATTGLADGANGRGLSWGGQSLSHSSHSVGPNCRWWT